MTTGTVYLVGGGPGDPGLLTTKARRLLTEADAIVYDRLVSPRLLSLARPNAQTYFVGKEASHHAVPQNQIEALLIGLAWAGKMVVRLKGGDPFVFGRGSEEALALQNAGIPWEVVPGITSAVAVPAYAGIPVTHRDVSPSFTVVTGHRKRDEELGQLRAALSAGSAVDADNPADTGKRSPADTGIPANTCSPANAGGAADTGSTGNTGTLVILMGLSQLREITETLITAGKSGDTPAAVIASGTRANQKTLVGTLAEIADLAETKGVKSPAIIVVGEVVRLRNQLAWFEQRPLAGKRILCIAQTRDAARKAADGLEAKGAEVLDISLEHLFVPNYHGIDALISAVVGGDSFGHQGCGPLRGILFSSAISVHAFFSRWKDLRKDVRALAGVHFGAADEAVAEALWQHGIAPDETFALRHRDAIHWGQVAKWIHKVSAQGQEIFVEDGAVNPIAAVPSPGAGRVIRATLIRPVLNSPILQAIRSFNINLVDALWTDSEFTLGLVEERIGQRIRERIAERIGERIGQPTGERITDRVGQRTGERIKERIEQRIEDLSGLIIERAGERGPGTSGRTMGMEFSNTQGRRAEDSR